MNFLNCNCKSNSNKRSIYSCKSKSRKNKLAVIWVSTVLYTLIALSIIGMLLAVVRPKLAEIKDRFIEEQTVNALNDFDKLVFDIRKATGNRRSYELKLGRGIMTLSGSDNSLEWILDDSKYQASELGATIEAGRLNLTTTKVGSNFVIKLKLKYTDINLTVNNADDDKVLQPSATPYRVQIENKGSPGTPGETRSFQRINIEVD